MASESPKRKRGVAASKLSQLFDDTTVDHLSKRRQFGAAAGPVLAPFPSMPAS